MPLPGRRQAEKTGGPMSAIENHVRTIIARVLSIPPEAVRNERALLAGAISYDKLRVISGRIERDYAISFPLREAEKWKTVGDAVEATEQAIAAMQESRRTEGEAA